MKQETIKVVVKEAGKGTEVKEIDNTLEELQGIVGGWIEVLSVGSGILMILNEEGKFKPECKPNFNMGMDTIMGTVLFAKSDGEEFGGLNEDEIFAVRDWLGEIE